MDVHGKCSRCRGQMTIHEGGCGFVCKKCGKISNSIDPIKPKENS